MTLLYFGVTAAQWVEYWTLNRKDTGLLPTRNAQVSCHDMIYRWKRHLAPVSTENANKSKPNQILLDKLIEYVAIFIEFIFVFNGSVIVSYIFGHTLNNCLKILCIQKND
ncbi:hypothetical protein CHS0354_033453 [Potamilus streckersoni]|uniref:Uncharacterized protein n=1 Tax=Potamilus streckersoni TaxID=2493646 RepID=A0AAE0VW77_9BIVA|nr:hypothetical protein CHS0354_033453 [Potamilus streckersoni]